VASRSLGALTLDLIAETKGFVEGMSQAERQAARTNAKLRKETQQTADTIARWGEQSVLAATAAGAAVAYFTVQAIEAVAAQNDLAQTVGSSQAELAGLGRAADLSGVSMDTLAGGMKKFNNLLGEAQGGSKGATEALDRLGLKADTLSAMPMAERFQTIAAAITGLQTQTERAAAAQDLFGKSGQDLLPMLQDGGETMRLAAEQAKAFGLALSDIDVAKISEADDAFTTFDAVLAGVKNQLAVAFAPAVIVAAERIADMAAEGRGFGEVMFEAFRVAAKGGGYVLDVVDAFVTILKIARLTTDGLALGFNLVAMSVDQVALSIDRVLGADTAENLKRRQEVITGTVAAGMARLATSWESTVAAFNAPLPHENVDKFFDDVQKKARETAAVTSGASASGGGGGRAPVAAAAEGSAVTEDFQAVLDAQTAAIEQANLERLAVQQAYKELQLESATLSAEEMGELERMRLADDLRYTEEAEAAKDELRKARLSDMKKAVDAEGRLLDAAASKSRTVAKAAAAFHKVMAAAAIIRDTYVAAMGAKAALSLIPFVGPALGEAAFWSTIALGGMALSAIGGGGAVGGGTTAGVNPTTATAAAGSNGGGAATPQVFDVRLVGSGRPTWEEIAETMTMIGERLADSGGRLGKVTVLTA
jgi:hypothetical protein